MGDAFTVAPYPPPPPSLPPSKSNLPMLYYGLVVVGTAAVVLALYNLILIKLCTHRSSAAVARAGMVSSLVEVTGRGVPETAAATRAQLSSFKYKTRAGREEIECAVCLSVVEDEEEVRELPRCKHAFHTACIDLWLYSHCDCPLCRTPVVPPAPRQWEPVNVVDNSWEGLLNSGVSPSV